MNAVYYELIGYIILLIIFSALTGYLFYSTWIKYERSNWAWIFSLIIQIVIVSEVVCSINQSFWGFNSVYQYVVAGSCIFFLSLIIGAMVIIIRISFEENLDKTKYRASYIKLDNMKTKNNCVPKIENKVYKYSDRKTTEFLRGKKAADRKRRNFKKKK